MITVIISTQSYIHECNAHLRNRAGIHIVRGRIKCPSCVCRTHSLMLGDMALTFSPLSKWNIWTPAVVPALNGTWPSWSEQLGLKNGDCELTVRWFL